MYSKTVSLLSLVCLCVLGTTLNAGTKKEVVWPATEIKYKEVMKGISKADLWGNAEKGAHGSLTKFTAGTTVAMHTHTNDVKLVTVTGTIVHMAEGGTEVKLTPGSYMMVPGGMKHTTSCTAETDCTFFEEQSGKFDVKMTEEKSAEAEKTTTTN